MPLHSLIVQQFELKTLDWDHSVFHWEDLRFRPELLAQQHSNQVDTPLRYTELIAHEPQIFASRTHSLAQRLLPLRYAALNKFLRNERLWIAVMWKSSAQDIKW